MQAPRTKPESLWMDTRAIADIVRQFPENGMKLLLQNPQNVRDLLALAGSDLIEAIDTDRMRLVPTTFVRRDYRHIESDVVLVAPLRERDRAPRDLLIYVLIEHQSAPDRMMPLRLLDYVVQIFNYQTRQWSKQHSSFRRFRLQPVLPVVFYTGTRRWQSVGGVCDLISGGKEFAAVTPVLEPLFINLPQIGAEKMERAGGYFGWVLRLVQQRKSRSKEFRDLLSRVVGQLESMRPADRLRWLELLSYVMALVYYERVPAERPTLQETIESSVRTDRYRQELSQMGKTIAEELIEEGKREGMREGVRAGEISSRQCTLIRLLAKRFGDVPAEVAAVIHATKEVRQLDDWLDQVVTAESLDDFEFDA